MTKQVIIIGAGLTGLIAARALSQQGCAVTVFERDPSVGGRMATHPLAQGVVDTGAQFFTAREPEFQAQIETWSQQGLVDIWGYGWSDGSVKRTFEDGHPRYIAKDGMGSLMQILAGDLENVHLNAEVTAIERTDANLWQVTDQNKTNYAANTLVLTQPVPQSLTLLNTSKIPLSHVDQETLERIEYSQCLTGVFVVEGTVTLPDPGAIQNFEEAVYWIGDNNRKGISPVTILTAHVEGRYSRQHYNAPDQETLGMIRQALQPYLAPDARIVDEQLEKWPYSLPLTTHPQDFYQLEGRSLFFAGDAFGGRGRVEGAYLSGVAVAKAILETSNAS